MKTYTEQLSGNEWAELSKWILPFGASSLDDFKYDLPYPLPCRVIYTYAPNTNYYVEVTFNENKIPHSYDNNPSVILNWQYTESYYMNDGKLHNTTGPAYISPKNKLYALNGIEYRTFDNWISKLHNYVSNEDVLAIKLKGEQ